MNYQQLSLGCQSKDILVTRPSTQFQCYQRQKNTILLYDGGCYLYLFDVLTKSERHKINFKKISANHSIINISYSNRYNIYFVLADDWKLYILSQKDLQLITTLSTEIKQSTTDFYFLEAASAFLIIANESIQLLQAHITQNLKFSSASPLTIKITKSIQMEDKPDWVKGQNVQIDQNYILLWDGMNLNIHQLDTLKLCFCHKSLCKKDNMITAALINKAFQYIIIGHTNG